MVYLKRLLDFVTYRMLNEASYDMCLESIDDDKSAVVVSHGGVNGDDENKWLVWDGRVFLIESVTPDEEKDTIHLSPPQKVFDRDVVYDPSWPHTDAGAFLAAAISANFISQSDTMYRVALSVSGAAGTFVLPAEVEDAMDALEEGETLGTVLWNVYDYILRLRNYDVFMEFSITGQSLSARIGQRSFGAYNVVFGDGHSVLDSHSYGGTDTVAKVTLITSGLSPERTETRYLQEDGEIAETPPSPRVSGRWVTKLVSVTWNDELTTEENEAAIAEALDEAAADAFGDSVHGAHRVDFWSDGDFKQGDVITMRLDGRRVVGSISRVKSISGNIRRHYSTGDLRLGLTDKLWLKQ